MSPRAVPSARTICQSALAPGTTFPFSSGPENVPPIQGTIRLRPALTSPTSTGSPNAASRRSGPDPHPRPGREPPSTPPLSRLDGDLLPGGRADPPGSPEVDEAFPFQIAALLVPGEEVEGVAVVGALQPPAGALRRAEQR